MPKSAALFIKTNRFGGGPYPYRKTISKPNRLKSGASNPMLNSERNLRRLIDATRKDGYYNALNSQSTGARENLMPEVIVRKGEPIDRALKRLKNKLDAEGIMEEVRRLRAFETPSQKVRRKAKAAAKRGKLKFRFNP
jgi:small subunit ribosomal protein S21